MSRSAIPRRIHVVGGEGSGKTTLASELSGILQIPVHHLDATAWMPTGEKEWEGFDPRYPPQVPIAVRPLAERESIVAALAAQPEWISEGKHIGWIDPLLTAADRVVWLDHVPFRRAIRRVVARSAGSAMRESRRRRGVSRYLRATYVRHGGEVVMQLARLARFYVDRRVVEPHPDAHGRITRVMIATVLEPHARKVMRIASDAQLAAFVDEIRRLSYQASNTSR